MSAPIETKLDNGVTVLYEKVPGVKVVSVQCWIKTGSVNENDKLSGISHFLEHMLFNGTKKFKPGEIDEYLDAKGGYNNAFTSLDVTNYYVTIPTDEAEAAYEVVSDMVFNALLLQSEIDREKPVVLQEINRKYDDPSYKMWQDLQAALFEGTPYARQVIGSSETVSAFTRQEIVDYYNRFYHPHNMTVVIVGDIEEKQALDLAAKYFNQTRDVPAGKLYKGENQVTFTKSIDKNFKADVNVDYAVFSFPTGAQDINTVYAEEVFAEVLSGGEYSLLNEIIKNKNNTAIYVTDIGLFNHYNGLFGAMAVVPRGNGEKFRNEAMEIINNIASGNIEESRIEKAKNRLKSKNIFEEENVSSLAQNIGYAYVLDFKDYHLNYENGIDKVTKDDIVAAANKMTSGPMYFGITSNE
ncbi:pitrilysin family protein [uncultured Brachyspira sp.]|uniref:M16 family metallopeptidase n=1 Tax=uncultured Brachyspira sp. TaxID=221953 RepID=UPI0026379374|nr:pitrilysin family protein [uncultured Brachyspira sp.]